MADDVAGDHGTETEGRPTPGRSRPDKESVLAALARHKSGAAESVPDAHEDEPDLPSGDVHEDDEVEDAPKPKTKKPKEPEPDEDEPADPDPDAEEPDEDVDVDADADEPEPEPEPEAKPDPELERRAAQLRRQETRLRAKIESERTKLERERAELAADRAKVDEFAKLRSRARFDPTGVLRALGLSDDDLEPAARHIYAQTKEAAKDPKNRDAADRLMRERELQHRIDEQQKRLDERDARDKQAAEREAEQRAAVKYITTVSKAAKPGTLAAHYLAKGGKVADKTMMRFASIAQDLAEDGELPDHSDVLEEYERQRREELEDDGIDIAALLKRPAAKPAAAKPVAGKPVTAPAKPAVPKPKAPAAAAPVAPKPKFKDADERNSSIVDMLAAQRAKGKL